MQNVYSNCKMFHFHDQLAALSGGLHPAPVHVRLKPTNRCTHRCHYCCYRNPDLLLSQNMDDSSSIPSNKMREIVSDLIQMGVRAVTFSGGGEPLCYPHIQETVQSLTDGGIKVAMLTHGGLLTGEIADTLARKATWIRISMDAATAESYARSRNVSLEEFDRVCQNIRNFASIEGRSCTLGLNLVVTQANHQDVGRFLELARNLGVDHVKVSAAVISTLPHENTEYLSQFHDAVKEQIQQAQAFLTSESFSIVDKFHLPDSAPESFQRNYHSCPFARFLTVIAADQNVYTCQDKAYTDTGLLGSLQNQSFRELWQSDQLQHRLNELDPSIDCQHHCVAHSKNLMLLDYLDSSPEHLDFV